ncbi:hypothetical protein HVPorG_04254 [Roseomonas mucosa]|nr:hypothetical protein HVPorG_04254 [Roseomonas mucosa]
MRCRWGGVPRGSIRPWGPSLRWVKPPGLHDHGGACGGSLRSAPSGTVRRGRRGMAVPGGQLDRLPCRC